ncbi:MAG: asparagine synthase (glutamine-hydrolyzing) [Bacteroidetes bacterium]|nr:asparagine synthase (glutamine-hydrolyzing) [Bacteroidota bacterium]
MCGIAGVLSFGEPVDRTVVQNMTTVLHHRGPDDEGYFFDEQIGLGHKRLSIIDLSQAGQQPMSDNSGNFQIVYNGELYNYQEIRNELADYNFKSETDTEVVLAAYCRWGLDCLSRFNGMFSFAIWDAEKKELFAARDRLGIKPLYYYSDSKHFVFASELRSILASGTVEKRIDMQALHDYLLFYTVHFPRTMIEGIKLLEPGYFLKYTQEGLTKTKYWDIFDKRVSNIGEQEVYERVGILVDKAVEKRMVADVPLGSFLSGGIDSGVITALMAKHSEKVRSFAIVFKEKDYTETEYSRMLADRFNTDHQEVVLEVSGLLEYLPDAVGSIDHPSADGINTYIISRLARESGLKVALSGLGGDELFAGYGSIFKRLSRLQHMEWLWSIPDFARKLAGGVLGKMGGIASGKLSDLIEGKGSSLKDAYPVLRQVLTQKQVSNIISSDELKPSDIGNYLEKEMERISSLPFISQVSISELSFYLHNILLRDTDQMSMANSLEVRVPFLDHELVEFVLSVPDELKVNGSPKKLLTNALPGLLPQEIIDRPKMGFTFPWELWMKDQLFPYCNEHIESFARREFIDEETVKGLWNDFQSGSNKVHWVPLWAMVVLEDWMATLSIEQ